MHAVELVGLVATADQQHSCHLVSGFYEVGNEEL